MLYTCWSASCWALRTVTATGTSFSASGRRSAVTTTSSRVVSFEFSFVLVPGAAVWACTAVVAPSMATAHARPSGQVCIFIIEPPQEVAKVQPAQPPDARGYSHTGALGIRLFGYMDSAGPNDGLAA